MFNHTNLYFIKASQTFIGQVFDLDLNNGKKWLQAENGSNPVYVFGRIVFARDFWY